VTGAAPRPAFRPPSNAPAPGGRRNDLRFNINGFPQDIRITGPVPSLKTIQGELALLTENAGPAPAVLIICDENTLPLALSLAGPGEAPRCVLAAGEENKTWGAVEQILRAAHDAGLGRDSLFIACGGGVVSDLAGFAASIYMRGVALVNVSTSLLGMVDAAVGGKTGFDLFGIKNLAGSFYPARLVYLPLGSLATLPPAEWKSGMAELIKTAVLDGEALFRPLETAARPGDGASPSPAALPREILEDALRRAVTYKGRIVEADPRETGGRRVLLNLGHSFGHALESSAGLGRVSHGEAVAWGMARACELGHALGITPTERSRRIVALLKAYGYEITAPHPLMGNPARFIKALGRDKKNRGGSNIFIIPSATSAEVLRNPPKEEFLLQIITGTVQPCPQ
jgi:3-dehydroquinate synthase